MRALTVQQPWAWAIVHGGKDVENRTQAWSYRGSLAIHAGNRWSQRGAESPLVVNACRNAPSAPMNPEWITGAIIGVVDLVNVHVAQGDCCSSPWGESPQETLSKLVHLELANPRPLLEPIPCRGRLGLWTPPDDVRQQLEETTTHA